MQPIIDKGDFFIGLILSLLVLFIAFLISKRIKDPTLKIIFYLSILIKLFASILNAFYVNAKLYQEPDALNYFNGAKELNTEFFNSATNIFKVLFYNVEHFLILGFNKEHFSTITSTLGYEASFLMMKIGAIAGLISFNSFIGSSIIIGSITCISNWLLYKTFLEHFQKHKIELSLCILFIPSFNFWCTGFSKDAIVFSSLSFLIYFAHEIFIKKSFQNLNLPLAILSLYILIKLKIILGLIAIPSIILWIYLLKIERKSELKPKNILFVFILFIFFAFIFFTTITSIEVFEKYNLGNIFIKLQEIWSFNSNNLTEASYQLHNLNATPIGLFQLIPEALFTSLFRPHIFEIKSVGLGILSTEATILTIISIMAFLKFIKNYKQILCSPHFYFCIILSCSMAIVIGISCSNFGTLTRYKATIIPFYSVAMFITFIKKE